MDYTKSPFLDIDLPPPLYIIPILPLIVINIALLCFDYFLYSNEKKFSRIISPSQLRVVTGLIHILLPMLVISDHPPVNALFTTAPWFLAVYTASFPISDNLTFEDWFFALVETIYEPKNKSELKHWASTKDIRIGGVAKLFRGVFKFVFLFVVVNPLLPPVARNTIEYPWFSLRGLSFILLFGTKHYCLLGILDIAFGIAQVVLGKHTIDSMHEPFLSTSPRDFWSRRWNLFVSYFLHSQVFARKKPASTMEKKKKDDDYNKNNEKSVIKSDKKMGWTQSKEFKGIITFVASGIFHEMMIMSICRKITLENITFFLIHGFAVFLEIKVRKETGWKSDPTGLARLLCIISNLFFFCLSGRLFVAPYLRDAFFDYNESSIYK